MMRISTVLLVAGGLVGFAAEATAAKLSVGDAAPTWSAIQGTDGKTHSLADLEAKAVVVVFTCNHCPVAKAYEERLIQLQRDYAARGAQVVAINVNKGESDRMEAMKVRAKEKGFNFPYLFDESQKSGRDYGAAVTPHVFLLDKNRKVAYIGAIDDNMDAGKAKNHYLRDALDAVLEGKEPPKTVTQQFGCGIKYE